METIGIKKDGPPIEWGFWVDNIKVAYYEAVLISPTNKVLKRFERQRTGDNTPDHFTIKVAPDKLNNCTLWVRSIIMDPVYKGGNYNAHLVLKQGDHILADFPYSGNIPPGNGKVDGISDEIKFV